jgi:peptide/nickel transport system permease protein
MARSLLRRGVLAVGKLLGVVFIAFVLLHLTGDPTAILLSPEASDDQRAAFRSAYGLDRPLPIQYGHYVARAVQGDFGRSFSFQEPALSVVLRRLPATIELAGAATLAAVVFAIPIGVIAAYRRGKMFDRVAMLFMYLGQAVPTFWLGMLMILVLAVQLHLFPVSGRGSLQHLVMPASALALWLMAMVARVTRSEMLEALGQEYVRTARAKGLAEAVIAGRHAFRNAVLPVLTVLGLQIGGLLGGAVMTETVFSWPGVGTLILDSILKKDFPVVLAGVIVISSGFVIIHTVLDLMYAALDPRIARR